MSIRPSFAINEWYHCYNRGVEKRLTFNDRYEYERFLKLLYITNNVDKIHLSDISKMSFEEVLNIPRTKPVCGIGAYCLMPNHFHLLIKEIVDGGITIFMQRLLTAYTMYFNIKNDRVGGLFIKPFRSRHIKDDVYFQYVINYIHLNPAELYEPGWRDGVVKNLNLLNKNLLSYRYSSYSDHHSKKKLTGYILDDSVFDVARKTKPKKMLEEAVRYYSSSNVKATP